MAIADDIQVQSDKDIRYVGAAHGASGAGYYSVIEFHRFLGTLGWQATSTGDDFLDRTRKLASERSTDNIITLINGYNIDDVMAEHLYDGTIIQSAGAEIYDGGLVFAPPGTDLQIIQSGAVIENDFWNTVPHGSSLKGLNANAAAGISHRFMIKVRTAGADIDGRRLIGLTRTLGKGYSEFKVNGTARGNNVFALAASDDLNNQTDATTISGWTDITLAAGYAALDVDNNGAPEGYYGQWDLGSHAINDLYERAKWLTRSGSSSTLYGLNGGLFRGVTHEIPVDGSTGTWPAYGAVSWTGGTAQMLAMDSTSSPTKMWIQLLTGVAPTDNQVITGPSAQTCSVNGSATERALSYPFVGLSTGSSLIGAYGVGIDPLDLSAADKLKDLSDTQRVPPNYVTFSVNGCVIGEDAIVVGPLNTTGDGIDDEQLTLSAAYSGATVTSITVDEAIPADTPASGTIRVQVAAARYKRVVYTSWSGSTFTVASTDFSGDTAEAGGGVWISYLDMDATATTESFTTIFTASRDLYVIVRDGGVVGDSPTKGFESPAVLGPSGGAVTIIRQSDA